MKRVRNGDTMATNSSILEQPELEYIDIELEYVEPENSSEQNTTDNESSQIFLDVMIVCCLVLALVMIIILIFIVLQQNWSNYFDN